MSDEGETALKRFQDWATLQFYIHDNDAPIFLPQPQTDEERAAFEQIKDIEQVDGRTVTPMDVERFNHLVPEWEATCDAMNAQADRDERAATLAFEEARRFYLEAQAISGAAELQESQSSLGRDAERRWHLRDMLPPDMLPLPEDLTELLATYPELEDMLRELEAENDQEPEPHGPDIEP